MSQKIGNVHQFPCEFSTDHTVLKFSMYFKPLSIEVSDRYVYNYKKAEWDLLKAKINDAPLSSVIKNAAGMMLGLNGYL